MCLVQSLPSPHCFLVQESGRVVMQWLSSQKHLSVEKTETMSGMVKKVGQLWKTPVIVPALQPEDEPKGRRLKSEWSEWQHQSDLVGCPHAGPPGGCGQSNRSSPPLTLGRSLVDFPASALLQGCDESGRTPWSLQVTWQASPRQLRDNTTFRWTNRSSHTVHLN